jgi:hypothetical protein
MIKLDWKYWNGSPSSWDDLMRSFENYTVFQSHSWGEYQADLGWYPMKLVGCKGSDVHAMTQILVKKYLFNLAVVWIPGGPVGDLLYLDDLRRAITSFVGTRFIYCRLNLMSEYSISVQGNLIFNGWKKSFFPLLSGFSLIYNPSTNEDVRQVKCSRNWRHNLRRSFKRELITSVWQNPDPNEMMMIYKEMQNYKQLREQTSHVKIRSLIKAFGSERLVLVRCDDASGNLLSFRGALVDREKGWDVLAATSISGRKVYASHATFWELMKQLASRNVICYDMGGVDLINCPGVTDFKKGTGAQDFRYVGEWDFAKPFILRYIANLIIGVFWKR